MVLIDSVALGHPLVANGSFENPDVSSEPGGYQYNPTDPTWTFVGDAGLASNGSDLTLGNPNAPDGSQVAFVQNAGYMFQIRNVAAGTYALHFQAAQREGNTRNQEVRVNLRPSGAGVSVKRFVWCGNQICEERDSSGATVTKRFFAEGEQRIGGSDAGNYYYSRDHLGSIREVTDASGALKARYDYDPYGKSVVVDGNMNVDFGYTGYYFHAASGLNLSLYRAYNPALGRWLSRDPIGETGGVNLYGYADNDPVDRVDSLGLYVNVPLADKAKYRAAWQYLIQVPEMREIFEKAYRSETLFTVKTNCNDKNGIDPHDETIAHWDPTAAHEYPNFTVQTPALALGHEFAHLVALDSGTAASRFPYIPYYHSPEERRVIEGPEAAAARFLGEAIRHNHDPVPIHRVAWPTSQW
jgi:RHS repeat-associated protein